MVVDKAVSIIGPGSSSFTLIAPVNETGMTISATGASVSGISISSSRSGLSVEADDVSLSDLSIAGVGNYAIKSTGENLTFSDLSLVGNGDGAIEVDGGSATITNSTIMGNTGTSLAILGGASVDLSSSTITDTLPTDPDNIADGFGVQLDDNSSLTSTDNVYSNNTLINIQVLSGSLSMSNDQVDNALSTGVWIEGTGDLIISNSTVVDNSNYGIVAMTTGSVSLDTVTLSVDPEFSPSIPVDEWADNNFASMGLFTNSPDVSVTDVSITGYNNCGANFQNDPTSAGFITIDGLSIDGIGRKGMYMSGLDGTIDNLSITNITDIDGLSSQEPDEEGNIPDYMSFCSLVDRNIGAVVAGGDLAMSNIDIENVEGYGLSVIQANVTADTVSTANSTCSSFIAFQSAAEISNSSFVGANATYDALGAMVVGYESSLLSISDSTFEGTSSMFFEMSVYARSGDNFSFTNNSFTGGSFGIYADDATLTVDSNTFTNQSDYSVYMSNGETRSHSFTDNTFQGDSTINMSAIYCYDSGQLEITGDSFNDLYDTYGISMNNCSSELEDVTFENTAGYGLYAYNGSHELENVNFINTGITSTYTYAAYFYAADPMDISISSSSFDSLSGNAVGAITYDSTNYPLNAQFSDLTFNNIGDDALYLYGATSVLDNILINTAGGNGIYAYNGTVDISNSNVVDAVGDAIYCSSCDITGDTIDLRNNTGNGVYLYNGSLSLSNSSILSNAESGIFGSSSVVTLSNVNSNSNGLGLDLSGNSSTYSSFSIISSDFSQNAKSGVSLEYSDGVIDNCTATGNGEYGMYCSASTFSSCATNDLTNNGIGEQTGCDSSCGLEAHELTCDDGLDNDVDGDFDCDDADCASFTACLPATETICDDGLDDDGDGDIDCNDSDCAADALCTSSETLCGDGLDDDGDGDIDCDDSDCATDSLCSSPSEINCVDGLDDDGDGDIDCDDSDCLSDPSCVLIETDCGDGLDDDADGDIDCDDIDCAADVLCVTVETVCDDGLDDDADGDIDCDDSDCTSDSACLPTTETVCDDGLDDDADGDTDCDDSDCTADSACLPTTEIVCDDGLDDDADGDTDCDDTDCAADAACALSYSTDVEPIFNSTGCLGCHGGSGGLTISYSNIVGMPSVDVPSMNLIEAGSTADSYIWHKLNGSQSSVGGAGGIMPQGGSLSASDLATVEAWINDGANP